MGNDGGTIPTRVELVKQRRKPKQVDKDAEAAAKWKHCQISQEPLRTPVVACDLGRLYNKDAVLQHLLNKKTGAGVAEHVRNLRDVYELNLMTEGSTRQDDVSSAGDEGGFYQKSLWICPVTGLEMNGRHPFSFITTCGCVISERALKALRSESCPHCNKPYSMDDLIPLNPGPEDLERLKYRMELRREQQKADKKAAKDAKKRSVEATAEDASPIKVAKTGASTSRTENSASGITTKHALSKDADVQKIANRSIATDPGASKVFKSLFTTSDTAKKQDHAHWVTHNPFYN